MAFQQGQSEARYCEILGVAPGASLDEIKKAYHQRVMEYHPDKVSHLGPKLRELAEREMKELNEAWEYFQRKFAEGGGRREEKTTVHCPKCLQKLAVPEGKRIRVTCPTCKTRFELVPEGTEDEEPASSGPRPEQEPPPRQKPPKIITNSIGMEFVLLPAGSFLMGSPEGEGNDDEHPQHQVTITRPFCLGKYPVTQAQWMALMGNNPSCFKGQTHPVEMVSWVDAVIFINRLNEREGHTRYRLPSEAEWEYACRAGTTTNYFFGDYAGQLDRFAWYDGNSGSRTQPVGQKEPNPWGLYDMHGSVWEWVWDWYNDWVYAASSPNDPFGPETGNQRVLRGGSCHSYIPEYCRSAVRHKKLPDTREAYIGFRLALMVE